MKNKEISIGLLRTGTKLLLVRNENLVFNSRLRIEKIYLCRLQCILYVCIYSP